MYLPYICYVLDMYLCAIMYHEGILFVLYTCYVLAMYMLCPCYVLAMYMLCSCYVHEVHMICICYVIQYTDYVHHVLIRYPCMILLFFFMQLLTRVKYSSFQCFYLCEHVVPRNTDINCPSVRSHILYLSISRCVKSRGAYIYPTNNMMRLTVFMCCVLALVSKTFLCCGNRIDVLKLIQLF